nr:Flp pilus assembly protein CpaB [uncultured Vibrio sp.]
MRIPHLSPELLKVLAGLLFVAALILGWMGLNTQPVPATAVKAQPGEPEFIVWRFNRDLPEGELIERQYLDMTRISFYGKKNVEDLSTAIGQRLKKAVYAGTDLTVDMLSEPRAIIDELPEDYRAVAVKANEVMTVGGHIRAGDRVDLIYLLKPNKATGPMPLARRLAEKVEVLAIGDQLTNSASTNREDNAKSVVLAIHESLAPLILLAESAGELRLAVVGHVDLPQPTNPAPTYPLIAKHLQFASAQYVPASAEVAVDRKAPRQDYSVNLKNLTRKQPLPEPVKLDQKTTPQKPVQRASYIEVIQGSERAWVKAGK